MSLVGLALLALSMVLPWWTLSSSSASGFATFDFGLGSVCIRPSSACTAYGPLVASEPGYRGVANTFAVAFFLVSLALVTAFLAVLLELAGGRPRMARRLAFLARLIAGIIALIVSAYVFVALPAAFSGSTLGYGSLITGFFGGSSGGSVALSYGGSFGWGLDLLGGMLLALASAFGLRRGPSGPPPT